MRVSKSPFGLIGITLAAAMFFTSCGSKVGGTYLGSGETFFDRLTFRSGGNVEIVFAGIVGQGHYEVSGNEVRVTAGTDTRVFTVDGNGCLDGGTLLGKYCKSVGTSNASSSSGGPLLGIYSAGTEDDGIQIQFQSGKRVAVTVSGEPAPSFGYYEVNGDRINVTMPGGQSITLVNKGNVLEGSLGGRTVNFVKQ